MTRPEPFRRSSARLGQRRLESLNYQVKSETSGGRALELLRSDPAAFDLVVTDYTMPKMTGLDFSEAVHNIRPDLPVILLSGFIEDLPQDRLAGARIARLIRKPASLEELATAVHQVLQGVR